MKGRAYLVTGGGGFTGASLVRRLVTQGAKVALLVEPHPDLWRLHDLLLSVDVFEADLADIATVRRIIEQVKPCVIYHMASYGGMPFQTDATRIYDTNFFGTMHLLNVAREVGFECFINTGSSAEYGFHDSPLHESLPLAPVSDFGVAKAAATHYCLKEALTRNLPVYTVRPFAVYGPYEAQTRLIPSLILGALQKGSVDLSAPHYVRDFIHVNDLINLYLAVERKRPHGSYIFNAGTGVQTSIAEVITLFEAAWENRLSITWGTVQTQQPELRSCKADISLARRVLGWTPMIPLRDGLAKSLAWFSKNLTLYQGVPTTHEHATCSWS